MAKKAEISDIVAENIKKYGINNGKFDGLRPTTQKHLLRIEAYLQSYINVLEELADKIKKSKLNLLTLTEETDISRSTIYNNSDTIKEYIDKRIAEIEAEDTLSLNKMNRREQEIIELREHYENIQLHLIDTEILEAKVKELEKELGDLRRINETHTAQISRLQRENQQLLQELSKANKTPKEVVNFSATN
ncbi:TPA: hypothetical protein ACTZ5N_001578 [Bacillus cereus]